MLRFSGALLAGTLAILIALPASAAVTFVPASSGQGTLVHGTNTVQTSTDVIGNLGTGGPNIVHFTGNTTETSSLVDKLTLQDGSGQADVTGAEITNNKYFDIISGNIFLTGHAGIGYIEFGLTGTTGGFVDFTISSMLNGVAPADQAFHIALGEGNTHFAFLAGAGEAITNVNYAAGAPPTAFTLLKQVRLDQAVPSAVPEPATWAMMLLGFGGMGVALRRRRRVAPRHLAQIA